MSKEILLIFLGVIFVLGVIMFYLRSIKIKKRNYEFIADLFNQLGENGEEKGLDKVHKKFTKTQSFCKTTNLKSPERKEVRHSTKMKLNSKKEKLLNGKEVIKMKKISCFLGVLSLLFVFWVSNLFAGEIDILVRKLVEKGILTPGEAQEILVETKEEVKKEIAMGKHETLPTWLQTIKLRGDFRARYQYTEKKGSEDRHRERIRLRVGAEAMVNEQMKVALGLATLGKANDPRSTNVTLGTGVNEETNNPGTFKDIGLDYAYAEYYPFGWLTLSAGKIKNALWEPSDLLWDTDINPDGGAVKLSYNLNSNLNLFMNNMAYALSESSSDASDPFMLAFQPGFDWKINDNLSLKSALSFYYFNSVKNKTKYTNQSTNTLVGNMYRYDYNIWSPAGELKIKNPFGGFFPHLAFFGEYVHNPDPDDQNQGYALGLKFGAEKIENRGDWQVTAMYTKLEKDAWLDISPDSDRYSGRTRMKGYEAILSYGLGKNTSLGIDYYYTKDLQKTGETYVPEQLLQIDWNLKF